MTKSATSKSAINPVGITPLSHGTPKILMCPPDYFALEYAINPWMENTAPLDRDLARRQWDTLYQAISQEAGVLVIEPVEGLPDLVFTANAAFIYGQEAIIAHYKHPERRGEEPHCAQWFKASGFNVTLPPNDIFFEGAGDALIWQDRIFAGYKTRTDIRSHTLLSEVTGLPVLSLELINPNFYHIDVCLCPLEDGHFIYSPEAFNEYGNLVIEANVPERKRIAVSPEEAAQFACNAINIGRRVIFNQGSNRLSEALFERGFNVTQIDLSEFLKSGGSAKCLSLRVA
ncbi:MAG: arginine deiminase-related protein [Vampirovibrionales bacterium]|nr:arginine deiminase-related protein [Vampirovibrionales bacterium]